MKYHSLTVYRSQRLTDTFKQSLKRMLQTLEKCNLQIKIETVQIDILSFTKESREIGRR